MFQIFLGQIESTRLKRAYPAIIVVSAILI